MYTYIYELNSFNGNNFDKNLMKIEEEYFFWKLNVHIQWTMTVIAKRNV